MADKAAEGLGLEIRSGIESLREALAAQITVDLDAQRLKLEGVERSLKTRSSTEDLAQIRTVVEGLQTRVDEIVSRPRLPGDGVASPARQIAERLYGSEAFRSAASSRAVMPRSGFGIFSPEEQGPSMLRALAGGPKQLRLSVTELGDFALPAYRGAPVLGRDAVTGFIMRTPYEQMPGARDYRVTKETAASRLGGVSTTLAADVVGGAGATATFAAVEGVTKGATWRLLKAAGYEDCVVLSVNTTTKVVTFAATIAASFTLGDRCCSLVYGATAEEALKPSGYFAGDESTYSFLLLATLIAISEQQIQTVEGIESLLRGRMTRRGSYNLEWQCIQGDSDNADQLSGILSDDDATTTVWSACPAGSNRVDAMLIAANECEMRGYVDIALELNPLDRLYALISKATDSHYVMSQFGPIRIGGGFIDRYPVGVSSLMPAGSGAAIDHGAAHVIGDRMLDQWALGYMGDDFGENVLRLRCEMDVLHAILSTEAYELIEFDSAP